MEYEIEDNVPIPAITRSNLGRLPIGARTSQSRFKPHLLRALANVGGTARTGQLRAEVLRVAELNSADREHLAGNPQRRWWNAAQWELQVMKRDNLVRNVS
ncbi:MAG: hypothetical protein ACREQ4_13760 [Candidatus Binataceae bacterium]